MLCDFMVSLFYHTQYDSLGAMGVSEIAFLMGVSENSIYTSHTIKKLEKLIDYHIDCFVTDEHIKSKLKSDKVIRKRFITWLINEWQQLSQENSRISDTDSFTDTV